MEETSALKRKLEDDVPAASGDDEAKQKRAEEIRRKHDWKRLDLTSFVMRYEADEVEMAVKMRGDLLEDVDKALHTPLICPPQPLVGRTL